MPDTTTKPEDEYHDAQDHVTKTPLVADLADYDKSDNEESKDLESTAAADAPLETPFYDVYSLSQLMYF